MSLQQHLIQSNDLSRLSAQPGQLDHAAYQNYLIQIGHDVSSQTPSTFPLKIGAQNSVLQLNGGDRSDNKTDFRADQALWSQDNLPDILYIFERPRGWPKKQDLEEPPLKKYNIYGHKLRDIPILPDHISGNVEGWRVEAWLRFDPRLILMDIMNRMEPSVRPANKSVVHMRLLRFRRDCSLLNWINPGQYYIDVRKQLVADMGQRGIDKTHNSTRGLSWGLINPSLGERGGRIYFHHSYRYADTVDMSGRLATSEMLATNLAAPTPASMTVRSQSLTITPGTNGNESIGESVEESTAQHNDASFSLSYEPIDRPGNASNSLSGHNEYGDYNDTSEHLGVNGYVGQGIDYFPQLPLSPQSVQFRSPSPTSTLRSSSPTMAAESPRASRIKSSSSQNLSMSPRKRGRPRGSRKQATASRSPQGLPGPQLPLPTAMPQFRVKANYNGEEIILKTTAERIENAAFADLLVRQWFPTGSTGRKLQLAYILDPRRIRRGETSFVDLRGRWPPVRLDGAIDPVTFNCDDYLGRDGEVEENELYIAMLMADQDGETGWECIAADIWYN